MKTFLVEFEYEHRKFGICADRAVVHAERLADATLRTLQEVTRIGYNGTVKSCVEIKDIVLLMD